jgi:hypothetical protein
VDPADYLGRRRELLVGQQAVPGHEIRLADAGTASELRRLGG